LWRAQAGWLLFGAALSLGALLAGAALMGFSGRTIALALAGGVIAVPLAVQAAGAARVVLRYGERLFTHEATFRALAGLRVWLFSGMARGSAGGLGFAKAGDALSRLVSDVDALDGLYLRISVPLLGGLVLVPILLFVFGRETVWALLLVFPFLFVAFYLPWRAARAAAGSGAVAGVAFSGLRNAVLDALSGLREAKIFGAEGRLLAAVQAREAALLGAQRALMRQTSAVNGVAFVAAQFTVLGAILVGFAAGGAHAVVAVFVAIAAFEAVLGLPRAGVLFGQAQTAAQRVVRAATAPAPVPDPAVAGRLPAGNAITFRDVSFRYGPDLPYVFQGLSMTLPAGSRTAILGPSGAGKSTVAALLLKLAAPERGSIAIGAADVMGLPAEAVRARIAYLSQATHLFADSVRNNLLLGDPAANDARLWAALETAQIADVVRALPDGLDAWLTEGGGTLSGGQGRRLALARTLLSRAPILLLDEPCAGLDAATEQEFFKVLNEAVAGRTVVLIAHRLTGVEQMDRIYRITGGNVVAAAA
jgi:ATP-binding cassette subfamily C protein CydC